MRNFLFLTTICCLPGICPCQDTLSFLVAPYLQFSTQNSISVLWETSEPASTYIRYGEAKLGVEQPPMPFEIELSGVRQMHEVQLSELQTETNYFWQIRSVRPNGDSLISPVYSFKTAVQDSSAYAFALVGDSQYNAKTPWAWSVISQEVWKKRPNFVVHAGDLVDWGPKKTDWTEHFFPGGAELMSRIPMFTVLGNHEGDADLYYQYMVNPAPEYRYTFKYGNAEFFMIDTNRDVSEGSDQYIWLEHALAKSNAQWKFAIHHHPPYSSESDDHGDSFKAASTMGTKARNLVPLFDKYRVDFSLFGHTHVYERTWPLKNNQINQKEGTIYINSGGAGGGLETFAPTRNWFTLELQEGHHFCTFNIFENTLIFKAIDHEGRVFDSFQMTKDIANSNLSQIIQPPLPIINSEKFVFHESTEVSIDAGFSDLTIRYTTNGEEPSSTSQLYDGPFLLDRNTTLKARAFTAQGKVSKTVTRTFTKREAFPAVQVEATKPGLSYSYYEGDWREGDNWRTPNPNYFSENTPKRKGILNRISFNELGVIDQEYWGCILEGYLEVPSTDTYTFYGLDARGLEIRIDGTLIIDTQSEIQALVQIPLEKGKHHLEIKTFQHNWRKSVGFGYYNMAVGRVPIRPTSLSHKE